MDTFYKDYSINVASSTSATQSVTLDRVATKLSVTVNKITTWEGALFGGSGSSSSGSVGITLDTDWAGTISYTW